MFKPVKLLGEVMALAYLVNKNTECCTFVDYAGHVEALEVRIYRGKGQDTEIKIHDLYIYIDGRHGTDAEKELLNLKSILEGYLFPNVEIDEQESTRP